MYVLTYKIVFDNRNFSADQFDRLVVPGLIYTKFSDNPEDLLYIFFHHTGQLLKTDTRNSLIGNPLSFDGTVYLNLELLVSRSISTSSNPCETNLEAYDLCLQDQYLDLFLRTNSCLLPFLKHQHSKSIPICETLESGFHALALFQQTSFSCLTPCLLVYADLTLQSEDKYISNSLTRYTFTHIIKNTDERRGLFIRLPKDIKLMESNFDFSLFSSITNFLGVAGLFFGISAYGCLNSLKDFLSWTANMINLKIRIHKYVKTIYLGTLLLASTVLLLIMLTVFISRYISCPTDTYVALETKLPGFSLSICDSKNITQLAMGNISMWREAADIRNQLSHFLIIDLDGKRSTVWNSSILKTQESIFKSFVFPLNNQTLQFCQTVDLQSYPGLKKVIVNAYSS
jgi:hypothetical protein